MWLAIYELYSPKWSKKLIDEFTAIFQKKRIDITREQIQRQVDLINRACPDALVQKYESLINSVELPDENDRHVIAAAIKCNANVIVTHNLSDFPNEYLEGIGITAIHPDDFIADMIDLSPKVCCDAFREMILTKNKPPYEEAEYLGIIRKNGLVQTSELLAKYLGISIS
jgi:predicted nucleic acid-binding protein